MKNSTLKDAGIESGEIKTIHGLKEGELEKALLTAMEENQSEEPSIKIIEGKSYLPLSWFIALGLVVLVMGAALMVGSPSVWKPVNSARKNG